MSSSHTTSLPHLGRVLARSTPGQHTSPYEKTNHGRSQPWQRDDAHVGAMPVELGACEPIEPPRGQRPATTRDKPVTGDRTARRERMLDELARRAAPRGFRIAYDLLRSRDQAEDAVQEALARACEHSERIRDADAASAWFYRVLSNICLRALRRRRVRRFILGDEHADSDQVIADIAEQARPDVELARNRELMRLYRALDSLPAKQRMALLLRYGHDLPITEIADMLNVRPATVKTHLVRGLERLRKAMESKS